MKAIILASTLIFASKVFAAESPKQTVENFYKSYLASLKDLSTKNPDGYTPEQADKSLRKVTDSYFTSSFADRMQAQTKKCAEVKEPSDDCDGDFFYCAQEAPSKITAENIKVSKDVAVADAVFCFNCRQPEEEKRRASLKLKQVNGKWKIDDLECGDPDEEFVLKIDKFSIDKNEHTAVFKVKTQSAFVKECKNDTKLFQKNGDRYVEVNKFVTPETIEFSGKYYLNGELKDEEADDACEETECRDAIENMEITTHLMKYEKLADKDKTPNFRALPLFGKFRVDFVNFYSDPECTQKKPMSYEFERTKVN